MVARYGTHSWPNSNLHVYMYALTVLVTVFDELGLALLWNLQESLERLTENEPYDTGENVHYCRGALVRLDN